MKVTITVPEAAATPDTIQFKIVLNNDVHSADSNVATSFRTFQQISWIHHKLKKAYPHIVIPALPETPVLNTIDDQDYVERKRMQIERFFNKIAIRPELIDHPDFNHFLSSDMSPNEVGPSNTGVLSFLRFNRVIKPSTDRGFRSFKPTEIIEGNDQDSFHKHQIYILLQESYFGTIVESLNHLIQIREEMGDTLANMGDILIETTQSKYRLGLGLGDSRELQRVLDKKMQMFGLLLDEIGFISTRQGKEEHIRFGDVIDEYKNSMDPLKVVFNARTIKLMDYVEKLKYRNRKRDKSDRLKLKLGMNHPMVTEVLQEEREAKKALKESKIEFDVCQEEVKSEIKLFEEQKRRDLKQSIKEFVQLSIKYEKTKLVNLETALHDMQQPNIRTIMPFNYQQQILYQQELQQQQHHYCLSPTSSFRMETDSSTASSYYDPHLSQHKKRRQKKDLIQKIQPLQSSASLPTCRKKSVEVESDSSDSGNNEVSISASYDDRLRSSVWLKE